MGKIDFQLIALGLSQSPVIDRDFGQIAGEERARRYRPVKGIRLRPGSDKAKAGDIATQSISPVGILLGG